MRYKGNSHITTASTSFKNKYAESLWAGLSVRVHNYEEYDRLVTEKHSGSSVPFGFRRS